MTIFGHRTQNMAKLTGPRSHGTYGLRMSRGLFTRRISRLTTNEIRKGHEQTPVTTPILSRTFLRKIRPKAYSPRNSYRSLESQNPSSQSENKNRPTTPDCVTD